jgi:hypothetical protein
MSIANDSLLQNLATLGFTLTDNLAANNATQALAFPLIGDFCRFLNAAANGTAILKSSLSNEAPPIVFVVNDSAQTMKVYCAIGETMSGVANGSLAIPSGQSGIFIRVPPAIAKGGGDVGTGVGDWRVAVIP